jgi:glycosyltransferase involved in cell wall biosynthesis
MSCSPPLKFSILVATFNRVDLLEPLFNSIDRAASKLREMEVEIVVVDDGSSDQTWEWLEEAKKQRGESLVIHRQVNSGRACALNKTFELASGDLGFIQDSDDLLTDNALSLVEEAWSTIQNDRSFAGVIGHCLHLEGPEKGKIIGAPFPDGLSSSDPEELRIHYKIKGDKKEVLRMALLKQNPFPLTPGERRVPTSLILNRIGASSKFKLIHDALIHKTYLEGGMSLTIDRTRAKSPHGSRRVYKEALQRKRFRDPRYTLRNASNLVRYNLHAGLPASNDFVVAPPFYASLAGLVMGLVLYRRDLKKHPELTKKQAQQK